MANYPSSLPSLATSRASTDLVGPDVLAADGEVNAIGAELGTLPKGAYSTVKARLDGIEFPTINAQTGTTYTLVLSDASRIVSMSNTAANSLKIPTDASVAFTIGTQITIRQANTGTTTVSAVTPGTTSLNSRGGVFGLAGQYAYATLIKVGANAWELAGDIA